MEKKKRRSKGLTRREFIKTTAAAGALAATGSLTRPLLARAAAKEIKVGIVLPYSGVYAMIGKRSEAAIRYAFHQSKYRDRVKFFTEDSRVKPAVSVEKAQKLVEKDGVDVLVGPAAGHTALAVSEYCKSAKKLMLLVYGGNVKIAGSNCSRYTFLCGHTTYSVSAPGVPWCVDNLGKEIFLVGADYSTGHDICGWFKEGYLKKGGTIVGEAYPPLGNAEYAPYLTQIMNAKPRPKVVAGFQGGSDAINITKQFAEFGLKKMGIPMVWTIGSYSEFICKAIGDAAEGHYDIHHWSPVLSHKENVEFMEGFPKFAKMEVEDAAVLGYEVGTTITYALDQTGGDTDNEKMIDAIEKRRWIGPRGECSFGPNHTIIHPTYIRQVRRIEGKLLPAIAAKLGPHTTPGGAGGPGGQCKL
jgi:branched-chain amino acid transport system substrate-binding protein